uniref:Restorer of fertility-like protein n=1 Tax=Triticum aestivum TaxID=4565 RepID=A0A7S5S172_WHEAT|nr:restorer of fertility-like protein [Triticum aestivum]QIP66687.1 restorer of fertility-like protein [Triticum aestivum]
MPGFSSAASMSPLRLRLRLHARHSSASQPSRRQGWDPHAAFAAATECARSGNLTPEDAHNLFDELLRQGNPVLGRPLNNLLAALARAPASSACRDGPALVVALFSRISQGARLRVLHPTACTYGILMDCSCRAHRLDLAFAFFGRLLRTGLKAGVIEVNSLLKGLCHAKRADEAMEVLLHRMPELFIGVQGTAVYRSLIQGFCTHGDLVKAKEYVTEMMKKGMPPPDIMFFSSIMQNLCTEGRVIEARDILDLIVRIGMRPDVFIFNILIGGYCLVGKMEDASKIFDDMVSYGLEPCNFTYGILINGYCKNKRIDDGLILFKEMLRKGLKPTTFNYNVILDGLFLAGQTVAAKEKFDEMVESGVSVCIDTYSIVLGGLCRNSCSSEAITLF